MKQSFLSSFLSFLSSFSVLTLASVRSLSNLLSHPTCPASPLTLYRRGSLSSHALRPHTALTQLTLALRPTCRVLPPILCHPTISPRFFFELKMPHSTYAIANMHASCSCRHIFLILRWNLDWGIPDTYFAIGEARYIGWSASSSSPHTFAPLYIMSFTGIDR